jgi:ketosteroid isomerase-like protein
MREMHRFLKGFAILGVECMEEGVNRFSSINFGHIKSIISSLLCARAVMKIYAEDAFIPVHGAPEITGHDIVRNIYKNHFEVAIESNSWITDLEVAESCDLAYGKGKFRSQMKGPDGPYWNEGKFLLTMKKTGGEWKLTGLCYTDDQIRT